MSFPNFVVLPYTEDITRARMSSAQTPEIAEKTPAVEYVWEWQPGTRNAQLVEKPSPTKTAQSAPSPSESMRGIAWRKVVETLRPAERKKRRAKEFDATMRREIENPIGVEEDAERRTVFSDEAASPYTAFAQRTLSGPEEIGGNWTAVLERMASKASSAYSVDYAVEDAESGNGDGFGEGMSLSDALAYIEPEEGRDEDEITALPVFSAQQWEQTPKKSKAEKVRKLRKARSMPL